MNDAKRWEQLAVGTHDQVPRKAEAEVQLGVLRYEIDRLDERVVLLDGVARHLHKAGVLHNRVIGVLLALQALTLLAIFWGVLVLLIS